jgi:hypothetical protein
MRILTRLLLTCLALGVLAAPDSRAASIDLQTPLTEVTSGSLLTVRVYGAGFPLGVDGGDFTLYWSENLEYESFAIQDPPWDLASFDDSTAADHSLGYVDVFALFDTPGAGGVEFDIATLVLRATDPGQAYVGIASNLVGWSLGGESLDFDFGPELELQVAEAPGPSALAQLLLAFAALGGVRARAR